MSDIEERLARLRPRPAPEEILRRAQGGATARRTLGWKEIPMTIAASALMALLVTVMWPQDPAKDKPAPAATQDDWMDGDMTKAEVDRIVGREAGHPPTLQKWLHELGSDDPTTRDAAQRELEKVLDLAIHDLREMKDAPDAEVRARVEKLIEAYGRRPKLAPAVARARKEGKPPAEWTSLFKRPFSGEIDWPKHLAAALDGDATAMGDVRAVGWHCAGALADAAQAGSAERRLAGRLLLREICAPLFEKRTRVTIDARPDNDAYGTSAYSFLFASQDADVHNNMVDLVYNGCGTLHFNPYGGAKNRIASLGEVDYAGVREAPEKGWLKDCVRPKQGHVYVFEGALATSVAMKKFAVKFVVVEVAAERVTIEWTPLGEMPKAPRMAGGGRAGTMGQCGGAHGER